MRGLSAYLHGEIEHGLLALGDVRLAIGGDLIGDERVLGPNA